MNRFQVHDTKNMHTLDDLRHAILIALDLTRVGLTTARQMSAQVQTDNTE
jgi:hypothetical protein